MLWILLGVLFVALVYYKIYQTSTIWSKMNVKHDDLASALVGTTKLIAQRIVLPQYMQRVYKRYRNERCVGFYLMLRPVLLINDLDLVRQITIKDFDHFTDHQNFTNVENEPLFSRTLFALKGDSWRSVRSTVSPVFTSSKMKSMYVLMVETAEQLTDYFINNDSKNVEVKDLFNRYGNDVIANCAFGVKCDSLKDRNNDFYEMGRQINPTKLTFRFFFLLMFPKLFDKLGLSLFPKSAVKFFQNLVAGSIKAREEQNIVRPDLIHLMMEAQKGQLKYEENEAAVKATGFATVEESEYGKSDKKEPMTLEMMTAQALIFFLAGFEAGSILMTFFCYELIINPDIQEKLIKEVDEAFKAGNGKVSYEALNKMKYLDMAVTETLRKWLGAGLDRECVKPYTIQPTRPGEKPVHIEPGFQVWIPNYAIQMDPEYYPNPERFDPERFSDENKNNIKQFSFLPFGAGPRNCIGSRFVLLEAKTAIVNLLSKFEVVANEKTEIPLKLRTGGMNAVPANGLYLNLKRRKM